MVLRLVRVPSRRGRWTLDRLVRRGGAIVEPKVMRQARRIVNDVQRRGDAALLKYVRELDGVKAKTVAELRLEASEGGGKLPAGFEAALQRAIVAVERFHEPQVKPGYRLEKEGIVLEERRTPLPRVGLYVPGGRFPYPSTVVMTVVPARLAGVGEIVVATPPQAFAASAALRFTLQRLDISEVWGVGGAHAIAALAYGTETIEPVNKILGPGNAWVTAAKRLVAGEVGIEGTAGPTEVVIVADESASPRLVAADLLAQAEHDPHAAPVLVTTDRHLGGKVAAELESQLRQLPTRKTARAALENFGTAFLVEDLEEALNVVERIAPEHLQLVGAGPEGLAERVRSAGAIFVGASTPEVFGDYVAGPSHVLPTCGTARFASSLGVEDFIRRSHCVRFDAAAAGRWAQTAALLAEVEGLAAHAAAARRRLPGERS